MIVHSFDQQYPHLLPPMQLHVRFVSLPLGLHFELLSIATIVAKKYANHDKNKF